MALDNEHADYGSILSRLLEDENPNISNYVQEFTQPLSYAIQHGDDDSSPESYLWDMWNQVVSIAKRTPHADQSSLVDAIAAIQKLPPPKKGNGTECIVWSMRVWDDLPIFGAKMREIWDEEYTNDAFVNLNAFAARLTSHPPFPPVRALDFSLYAIWKIREVLEAPERSQPTPRAVEEANVWFIYAAEVLWKLSKDEKTFDGRMARPGEGFKERDWTGFSVERWRIWSQRLEMVKGYVEEGRVDSEIMKKARGKMREVEEAG
ncbi:hypothetical protein M501DRAFT_930869 [Patellaria atrata CBS 101060]|uniref:Uncharacterized protein n=1 Tax=Patellaria atrata CBS 101060 TaxID=1346257 RepID=A0A9P4SER4_9PEZI|nr:hypothetical protein M501DRAFT_930869 [Patellaria atrata CBS 101060]